MQVQRSTNRLYTLNLHLIASVCLQVKANDAAWRWHARYGHLNFRALHELGAKKMVEGIPTIDRLEQFCDGCALGKQHRKAFPSVATYRAKLRLELLHGDLCGPITPITPGGGRYFMLIVDDHSRYMWVEILKTKDEAFKLFKKIKSIAENETNAKVKAFRIDRGKEFNSILFNDYCDEQGIRRHLTAPYSPQQNGVVERRNQTVVEMARSLLKSKCMPDMFWGEVVKTAVHILNRAPTRSLDDKTPYEVWYKKKPNVGYFQTFGCLAHVKKLGPATTKLLDRSAPMVFLGYEEGSKAYRVFDPVLKKLHITRDVVFEEEKQWEWVMPTDVMMLPNDINTFGTKLTNGFFVGTNNASTDSCSSDPTSPSTPTSDSQCDTKWATPPTGETHNLEGAPLRYRTIPDIYRNTQAMDLNEETSHNSFCFMAAEEPSSVQEALKDAAWKHAMDVEMKSILDNKTWELTDLPNGQRAIGLKWVFKAKKDQKGNVVKYKARLVAKGYAQREGLDFDEVYAPVARLETIRLLLALAAHEGWQVHHMDVKSAFLNGDLKEEVHVQQPLGYIDNKHKHKVLRLHKALYGLRQAPRAWNAKLDNTLISLGFERSPLEHAVYKRSKTYTFLLVGVYVDDLIITGSCEKDITEFKTQMQKIFNMSDLGLLSYYLGIEVKQETGVITLTQSSYARKILEVSSMAGCNSCTTPMENRLKLSKKDGSPMVDATNFRSIVGSLRYLVNTRPDIAYAVGMVSRYMEAPTTQHMAAVKHILRYIKGTIGFGCRYEKQESEDPKLVIYSDSDLAGDTQDRKSTTGTAVFLGTSLISWTSQKQKVVALSSCEAEYIAAATAACQAIWFSRLLGNLTGVNTKTVKILVDNKSAIALSKNPVHHDHSKHIDIRYHFIRDCVEKGAVEVEHISTDEQLADILTKALGRVKFLEFRLKIGVTEVKSLRPG